MPVTLLCILFVTHLNSPQIHGGRYYYYPCVTNEVSVTCQDRSSTGWSYGRKELVYCKVPWQLTKTDCLKTWAMAKCKSCLLHPSSYQGGHASSTMLLRWWILPKDCTPDPWSCRQNSWCYSQSPMLSWEDRGGGKTYPTILLFFPVLMTPERSLGFANHAASKLHNQRAEGPILEFDTQICQISVCCPRMSD